MATAITTQPQNQDAPFLNPTDIQLIRRTIAKDATDPEFEYFVKMASLRQLNPLLNQIALQIRNADRSDKRAAVVITTIHGLRLIASRTGNYMPGRDTTFVLDERGNLISATAYVKKYHATSGTWHEISETAYWDEFKQAYNNGDLMGLWGSKPRLMLAKCAEALALRRAFPEDLSGLYTDDEMGQADNAPSYTVHNPATGEVVDGRPTTAVETRHAASQAQAIPQAKPTNGSASSPVSRVQRANLLSHYAEIYGCDERSAIAGVDGLFHAKFGHDMEAASYAEGSQVMAQLLQMKQQAAAGQPA